MDIALLNVKITLQKSLVTVDNIGNHTAEWVDHYSCFATVSNESPSENTSAGVVVDNSKIDFTVRYCKKVAEVNSTNYRVMFIGEVYEILGVDHMNFKKKAVKLKCQKVRD